MLPALVITQNILDKINGWALLFRRYARQIDYLTLIFGSIYHILVAFHFTYLLLLHRCETRYPNAIDSGLIICILRPKTHSLCFR